MIKVTNSEAPVNRKITPIFKNLFGALGFDDDLHYTPSLESQVSTWTKPRDESGDDIRFTVNVFPELVRSTVLYLRGKHENLPTQSAVQRFLLRAGITILEKIPSLKKYIDNRRFAYESGIEKDRVALEDHHYSIKHRISLTHYRTTVCAWRWVGSKIIEIASDLNLPHETLVVECLIAGTTTSEQWVPSKHRDLMLDEMIRFITWVEGEANRV
jgi:hypothetical protein